MHTLFEDYINQFAYYGYHVSLNTFDNPVRFGDGLTSSPTFVLRDSGGGSPLVGDD